jgi:hypothetical protein
VDLECATGNASEAVEYLCGLRQDALGSVQGTLDNEVAHAESFFRSRLLDAGLFVFVRQN